MFMTRANRVNLLHLAKPNLHAVLGVFDSDWVILVEGRADVINLLRAGFDNAIAIEGAKIDETITKLTEGKKVIAFLDGDRAGDLILKELQGLVKIDKILRAPMGREVEECTPLEIAEILKETMPIVTANGQQRTQSLQQAGSIQLQKQERQQQIEEQQLQITSQSNSNIKEEDIGILLAVKEVYPQINETLKQVLIVQ